MATATAIPTAKPAPAPLALTGSLALQQGSHLLGGADRIALLEAIHATGSVTQAAKAVGLSYKTAWDRVQDMNNVAGQPLVDRTAGGPGGGGTTLTPYGLEVIAAFRRIEQTHAQVLAQLSTSLAHPREVLHTLSTLGLRTSARNQLSGTVTRVVKGEVNALVELTLPKAGTQRGRDVVWASLTMASLQELGIAKGRQAVALIKAPSVSLALPGSPASKPKELPPRNALAGQVVAVHAGASHTEVQMRLKGGQIMVSTVSGDLAHALSVSEGMSVLALFAESSVILGVT